MRFVGVMSLIGPEDLGPRLPVRGVVGGLRLGGSVVREQITVCYDMPLWGNVSKWN